MIILLYSFLLLIPSNSWADVTFDIKALTKKYQLHQSEVAFELKEISTQKVINTHNADLALIPASITKVLTSLYALDILGDQFQFSTNLAYSGKIKDGVLKGDLHLIGQGDPSLLSSDLFDMALHLSALGVSKVEGQFFYNDSLLPKGEIINPQGHTDHTYNSSYSALSCDFNQFMYQDLEPIPMLEHLKIHSKESKIGNLNKFLFSDKGWLSSKKKKYARFESLPLKRPSLYTAKLFHSFARKLGISLAEPEEAKKDIKLKLIVSHKSDQLINLAKLALEYSNNLFAELLLLKASHHKHGDAKTLEDSAAYMREWLIKNIPSAFWGDIKLVNGSGLTSLNRISPRLMNDILSFARVQKYSKHYFWPILSLSGHSGWIQKRFRNHNLAYNVWGKTGSLDYVSSIAGFLISSSGKIYSYSILINDLKKRKKMSEGLNSKHNFYKNDRQIGSWRANALSLQNELIGLWYKN